MTIKECKDGLLNLEDLVYETHQWLEGLEATEKELRIYKKELEVYRKAFILACAGVEKMCAITNHCDEVNCPIYNDCRNCSSWEEVYLQKAREE